MENTDTTEARLQKRFPDREAWLRLLLMADIDGFIITDGRGRIKMLNPAATSLFQYPPAELIGQPVERLIAASAREPFFHMFRREVEPSEGIAGLKVYDLVGKRSDGSTFPMKISIDEGLWNDERHLALFVHDLSEPTHREKEMLVMEALQRREISTELHEEVGQLLTGISLLCRKLYQRLDAQGLQEAAEAQSIEALMKEALAKTRALSRELASLPRDVLDLGEALHELAVRTQSLYGIACQFHVNRELPRFHTAAVLHLYRITQEAIHLGIRHGNTNRVRITVAVQGDMLALTISHNGLEGMPEVRQEPGLGLRLMQYRAHLLGASLRLDTSNKGGMIIICVAPLSMLAEFTDPH